MLVGAIVGPGLRDLAGSYEHALRTTSSAMTAAADRLRSTARTYREAEDRSAAGLTGTGGAP